MSSIIFCDGFDHYTTILDKWDAVLVNGGTPTIAPGVGRGGAGALSVNRINTSNPQVQVQKDIGAHTTLYVGFAFYFNPTGQSVDQVVCMFQDGFTVQVALWITPTGTMYFTRGGALATNILGTAGTAYPTNSFHYVEVSVTINGSTGACQLRVDQNVVSGMNVTGANTKASANNSFDSVLLGPMSSGLSVNTYAAYFDDVYFDTSGFNGDVRVNGQLPSGNGSTQNFANVEASWAANAVTNLQTTIFDGTNLQRATAITGDFKTGGSAPTWNVTLGGTTTDNHVTWTNLGTVSQYKLVNETDPDSESSYIQSNTLNDISRFTYPAISGSSVLAVVVWPNSRKDDGGTRTIQASIKSGSTIGTSGTDVALGTNYQYQMLQSLTDPNTGAAWTLAAVNAAEFGIKITRETLHKFLSRALIG